MKRVRKNLCRLWSTILAVLMLSTCFGFCIFAAAKTDEQNAKTYSRDGFTVTYDPHAFWAFEGCEEGDVVRFNYCGAENVTANLGIDLTDYTSIEDAIGSFDTYSFECVANTTFHGDPAVAASTGLQTTHFNGQTIVGSTTIIAVNHNGKIYVMDVYITDAGREEDYQKADKAMVKLMDSVTFTDFPDEI